MNPKTMGNKYFGILKGDVPKVQVRFQNRRRKMSKDLDQRAPFSPL